MIYCLNGTTYWDLERDTMIHLVAAIRAYVRPDMPDRLLVQLQNTCAILECQIEREPEPDPNADLIS